MRVTPGSGNRVSDPVGYDRNRACFCDWVANDAEDNALGTGRMARHGMGSCFEEKDAAWPKRKDSLRSCPDLEVEAFGRA